mgnify:CR=1 FL=1|jgi:hypothetical protein
MKIKTFIHNMSDTALGSEERDEDLNKFIETPDIVVKSISTTCSEGPHCLLSVVTTVEYCKT